MKTILSTVLPLALFIVISCSDDKENPQPKNDEDDGRKFGKCRITVDAREGFATRYYEYDDQGRLLSNKTNTYLAEYSYSGDQLIIETYSYGSPQTTLTVTLDDKGRPSKWVKVHFNGQKPDTRVYQYDNKGQLIRTTETTEGSTAERHIVYQWVDGNMVAESRPDGSQMTTYTYTNEEVQPADWFGEIGVDYGLRAIRNKNRLSSMTTSIGVYEISYGTDETGLIKFITTKTPSTTYTNDYTSVCK